MEKVVHGKKIGMSQYIDAEGIVTPVTIVRVMPLTIIKKLSNNNVESLLIGYDEVEVDKLNKPKQGIFKKNGTKSFKKIKEYKLKDMGSMQTNDELDISLFQENDKVSV